MLDMHNAECKTKLTLVSGPTLLTPDLEANSYVSSSESKSLKARLAHAAWLSQCCHPCGFSPVCRCLTLSIEINAVHRIIPPDRTTVYESERYGKFTNRIFS